MDFGSSPKRKRFKSSRGVPGNCQMTGFPTATDFHYSINVSSLAFIGKKKKVVHYRNLFVLA